MELRTILARREGVEVALERLLVVRFALFALGRCQSCLLASQRSASMAAAQPVPAAVTACR
jgi:hypothetical protein